MNTNTHTFIKSLLIVLFVGISFLLIGQINQVKAITAGPNYGTSSTGSDVAWSNPNNAMVDDSVFATLNNSAANSGKNLKITGFGFSIPVGATINSVTSDLKIKQDTSGGSTYVLWGKFNNSFAPGTFGTSAGAVYPTTTSTWYNGEVTSGHTWTVSEINGADFGVYVKVNSSSVIEIFSVDSVRLTVNYTAAAPTVTTPIKSFINASNATLGANVTSDGGATVTTRGVCIGTSIDPALGDTCFKSSGTTGIFTVNVAGLIANTPYHYRGYAVNSSGPAYSAGDTFTTLSPATGCTIPLTGDMTVSSDCAIPINGMVNTTSIIKVLGTDSGTINLNAHLTNNFGNIIVWGPGKQIVRSPGVSIFIATGSQITQKYTCFYDPDNDGVPNDYATTTQGGNAILQASCSCPANYIRPSGLNSAFDSFNTAQTDQFPDDNLKW